MIPAVRNTASHFNNGCRHRYGGRIFSDVVTLASHGVKDGMQITLSGGDYQVDSVTISDDTVYCAKNVTTNTFELYTSDGDNWM